MIKVLQNTINEVQQNDRCVLYCCSLSHVRHFAHFTITSHRWINLSSILIGYPDEHNKSMVSELSSSVSRLLAAVILLEIDGEN